MKKNIKYYSVLANMTFYHTFLGCKNESTHIRKGNCGISDAD